MSAMSYTYTTLDVSPLTMTQDLILTRVLQADAELSRLIGTLRLDAKVRAFL